MNYKNHREAYIDFLQAKAAYDAICDEYLAAFQKTQPHSPSYLGVQFSGIVNKTEEYIIEVESKSLKSRAEIAEMKLNARKYLLDMNESELRKSFDIYDVLYVAKWIDNKSTKAIIQEVNRKGICYSASQIYSILKRLNTEIGCN